MSPAKKAAEVARQPVVMLSGSAVIAVLGFLGLKSGVTTAAAKASEEPNANLVIIANTVDQMKTQNDKNFDRLNDSFDKMVELYTDNHSEISILKNRVGRNESDIRDMENWRNDPVGGND